MDAPVDVPDLKYRPLHMCTHMYTQSLPHIKGFPTHAASTFVLQGFMHSTSRSKEKLMQHACIQSEAARTLLTNAPQLFARY